MSYTIEIPGISRKVTVADRDDEAYLRRLAARALRGKPQAACEVGQNFSPGGFFRRSRAAEKSWYRRSWSGGYLPAANLLALALADEGPKQRKEALVVLRSAAARGGLDAEAILGTWFIDGTGVRRNVRRGLGILRRAARSGSMLAADELASMYLEGKVVRRNRPAAVRWLTANAMRDDSIAAFRLARCYEDGVGVKPSVKLAFQWMKRAAELGDVSAMADVGFYYDNGIGTSQNSQDAIRWYRSAATRGDGVSAFNLALIYWRRGQSGRARASIWFARAASLGHPRSRQFLSSGDERVLDGVL